MFYFFSIPADEMRDSCSRGKHSTSRLCNKLKWIPERAVTSLSSPHTHDAHIRACLFLSSCRVIAFTKCLAHGHLMTKKKNPPGFSGIKTSISWHESSTCVTEVRGKLSQTHDGLYMGCFVLMISIKFQTKFDQDDANTSMMLNCKGL